MPSEQFQPAPKLESDLCRRLVDAENLGLLDHRGFENLDCLEAFGRRLPLTIDEQIRIRLQSPEGSHANFTAIDQALFDDDLLFFRIGKLEAELALAVELAEEF